MATGQTEQRILVLAPTGRDGPLACQTLERAGLVAELVRRPDRLADSIEAGAGAVLVAEEALSPSLLDPLSAVLQRQPPWSDLPLLVFAAPMEMTASTARLQRMSELLGNVTVLERPVRVATLVTAVRAALRARNRQYTARSTMTALERQELALKRADQRKDDFLAMLAHELRNPMAALSMALALLEKNSGHPEQTSRYHQMARRQLGHLVRLVDDLLDVSRITRGTIELRKDDLDLGVLAESVVAAARPMLDGLGLVLEVERPEERLPVHADGTRIEQVVTNLLSNAAKFTERGGQVQIRLRRERESGVLAVSDTGRGIPARMMDQVFEPFVQVEPGLDRTKGGLGLGLTLVRRLVEMHGGTVTATSAGPGLGSTFEVRLPLRGAAGADRSDTRPLASTDLAPRRRILLVEDSRDVRETMADYLKDLGHTVELATNGYEGAEKLLALRPDLALVDVGLPGIDGYEVARRVRAEPGGRDLFLVALTGYGGPEAEAHARLAGFDLHLTKPVDTHRLHALLAAPGSVG